LGSKEFTAGRLLNQLTGLAEPARSAQQAVCLS